ncbi:MAG: hypothetical protein GEU82_17870 [Luteitalea sp.]|nr:hypothetical protein [Luteitalea sp.]
MAWKSLVAHPVRTAVLGVGFGLGVSVMATLLGVGQVVLQQARAPALAGGGDLLITGSTGALTSARFVLGRLQEAAAGNPVVASPQRRAELFLVGPGGVVPVGARGGIPSLESALGDPETSRIASWQDSPADAAWASLDPAAVLRAMDRFHPIPDVPARSASWAEWLYFRGQSRDVQFYITFLVGPKQPDGRRIAGVRLQLDRGGRQTTYSDSALLSEADVIASAPDLTIGRSRVRLEGMRYRITLDLPEGSRGAPGAGMSRALADIVVEAQPGRSVAPIVIRGAGGWLSGYVVPVMSGALSGALTVSGTEVMLAGTAYHDHNWGFWEGVSWRWGQVQHEGFSYVYGRVYPPPDAADPARVPGFLVAIGPDGPVGYGTNVTITETDDPETGRPTRIVVEGRGSGVDLKMDLTVESAIVTAGGALASGPDFLQLRVRYHVTGRAGGDELDFTAPGAAETFRGR